MFLAMRPAVRLAFALLLVIAAAAPAAAQQSQQSQEELLRQRWLLKEKFNKGWDVTSENEHDKRWIASRCKTEARKQIPGIHPIKHRRFIKRCIAEAGR